MAEVTGRSNGPRRSGSKFQRRGASTSEAAVTAIAKTPIGAANEMDQALESDDGTAMFVPPWCLIMERLLKGSEPDTGGEAVTVPRKLLQFLFRCLLDHTDFDEKQYRECNPDVAEAIRKKVFSSGRDHFTKVGYFEDRKGGTSVHEIWYLARNPDVAAAKQSGQVASGELQYRLAGAHEWREPNPEAVKWIRAWKDALERKK
jgi:hypothetical protein